jgi:hypothetical protein
MNNVMLSASYHKSIGKEHKHFLGIGIQGGYTQKSVNWNQLTYPDQNAGDYFDLTKPNNESIAKGKLSYFDINAGLLYQGWIKKDEDGIFTGVSFAHLNSPKQSFYDQDFIGVWDRINDAFITSAGIEYYKVRLSFAYDITTSSLTYATENRSAFELAIIYTGFIKSKDVQYPKLVPCPRM